MARIDAELAKPALPPPYVEEQPSVKTAHEAIIPAISDKPLPVYFLKDADLKEQMVQGQSNPLKDATFIVDADVQMIAKGLRRHSRSQGDRQWRIMAVLSARARRVG